MKHRNVPWETFHSDLKGNDYLTRDVALCIMRELALVPRRRRPVLRVVGLGKTIRAAFASPLEQKNRRHRTMKKYVCGPCGYEYDPAVGDPDSGIAPGTAFEDLPEDWVCPVCGVTKDDFTPIE